MRSARRSRPASPRATRAASTAAHTPWISSRAQIRRHVSCCPPRAPLQLALWLPPPHRCHRRRQELGLHPSDEFNLQPAGAVANVRSFVNQEKLVHEGLEASRERALAADNAAAGLKRPIAWLSALGVSRAEDCLYTLTAWNLPVVDVPHLYTSVGVSGGAIELCIDFRPRAEAGYLSRLPDGSYPEPTSREMFMEAMLTHSRVEGSKHSTLSRAPVCMLLPPSA